MLYVEKIENHKIGNSTPFADVALSLGWTLTIDENDTEKAYDGSLWEKGYAPEKPAKEIAQEKIEELKTELAKSDYIDNKFIEAMVKNDNELLDALKIKYKDKLEERQAIRSRIDELKEILNG